MAKQYKSDALAAAHETALGLKEAGVMVTRTMKAFDEMCLTAVEEMAPEESGRSGYGRMRASGVRPLRQCDDRLGEPVGAWREAAPRCFAEAPDVGREEGSRGGRLTDSVAHIV